jgi:hypothetical protein
LAPTVAAAAWTRTHARLLMMMLVLPLVPSPAANWVRDAAGALPDVLAWAMVSVMVRRWCQA